MECIAKPASVQEISHWRDLYRKEMNCQIVHDSMHGHLGWTEPFLLYAGGETAGYGSILIRGPWTGTRTIFEFFVLPAWRSRAFDLFSAFVAASGATAMRAQTNDRLLAVMLHVWARDISSERILFEDRLTSALSLEGVVLRERGEPDNDWVLEADGVVAAKGGVLYHYNRPYGDVYMEVAEPFRQRGFGSYLVQELKRICRAQGSVPCARCSPENIASRKTLQKAGFVPCGHILAGTIPAGAVKQ